jgi:predicted LPLAT superfamily acyltransferase
VLFSAVYCGGRRYRVRFEAFADAQEAASADRREAIPAQVQRYADWLASACRAAPYNWFNFYDFWTHARAA